jgi:hypothetical protein
VEVAGYGIAAQRNGELSPQKRTPSRIVLGGLKSVASLRLLRLDGSSGDGPPSLA